MDIELEKERFLNLLRNAYKAKQVKLKKGGSSAIIYDTNAFVAETLDHWEQENRVQINEDTLIKFGFKGIDFWEMLVPALQEEGYIDSFGDPYHIPSEYFERTIGYSELRERLRKLNAQLPQSYLLAKSYASTESRLINIQAKEHKIKRIEEEIGKTVKELDQIISSKRNYYPFFVVNAEKLIPKENKTTDQLIIIDNTPSGLKWENTNWRLIDGHTIHISSHDGKWVQQLSCELMGLMKSNTRPLVPNKQWKNLVNLLEEKGELRVKNYKISAIEKSMQKLNQSFKIKFPNVAGKIIERINTDTWRCNFMLKT